jgi:uncharacterized protein YbjT (DUF2867 family)
VLDGVQSAFVMVNMPGDPAQGSNWARALRGSGVRRIVLMSSLTIGNVLDEPITEIHTSNESAIRATEIPATFVRPGIFMSNVKMWAESIRRNNAVSALPGDHPFAPIHEADIAAVAAVVLTTAGHDGAVYPLTGSETMRPSDQVRQLGAALGREISFHEVPQSVALAALAGAAGERNEALLEAMAGPDAPWRRPLPTVEQVTGRPARTFGDWVTENIQWFS